MPPTFDEDRTPKVRSEADPEQSGSLWDAPAELLRGVESVNRMVVRLFSEARRELVLFIGRPMLADSEVESAFRDLQERGVAVRQILSADFLLSDDAESRRYVDTQRRQLANTGRRVDELPGKLIVVDRRVGLVALNQETGVAHQAMIMRHRNLVVHLQASFENHWQRAATVEA